MLLSLVLPTISLHCIFLMPACSHSYSNWLQIGMSGWFTHYSFRCQPVDYSDNPSAIRVSGICPSLWTSSVPYSQSGTNFPAPLARGSTQVLWWPAVGRYFILLFIKLCWMSYLSIAAKCQLYTLICGTACGWYILCDMGILCIQCFVL